MIKITKVSQLTNCQSSSKSMLKKSGKVLVSGFAKVCCKNLKSIDRLVPLITDQALC